MRTIFARALLPCVIGVASIGATPTPSTRPTSTITKRNAVAAARGTTLPADPKRAWLGVGFSTIAKLKEVAKAEGAKGSAIANAIPLGAKGVFVIQVAPTGSLAASGLKEMD